MMSSMRIKSRENPNLEISAFRGHFATRHSHNSHYLDLSLIHISEPTRRY